MHPHDVAGTRASLCLVCLDRIKCNGGKSANLAAHAEIGVARFKGPRRQRKHLPVRAMVELDLQILTAVARNDDLCTCTSFPSSV